MWRIRFSCPRCAEALLCERSPGEAGGSVVCRQCGVLYRQRSGIWRFLDPVIEAALEPFLGQYRSVRDREGRRDLTDIQYRNLPTVAPTDARAQEWGVRRETYHHLLRHVLAAGRQPSTILDLGCGNGWLAHRLSALRHHVAAVDVSDDARDGLGAVQRYGSEVVAIQADFDALPLGPSQFDIVIFNGSLHYSPDPARTLASVCRLLQPAGTLVVMDSPMFHADVDGVAMLAATVHRFAEDYGLENSVIPGRGYLTFALLAQTADAMRLDARFVPSRGSLVWRLGRQLARFRQGRQPAAFGLWMAR
jgi:SAM-dependent methyltransferase